MHLKEINFKRNQHVDYSDAIIGSWFEVGTARATLVVSPGTYRWGEVEGRWMMQGQELWLLDPKTNAGTKWLVAIQRPMKGQTTLTLSQPEDFTYLGRGQYVYFQMTSPSLTHVFEITEI